MKRVDDIKKSALQVAKQITMADSNQMCLSEIKQSLNGEYYFDVIELLRKSGAATFVDYTGGDSSIILSKDDYDKFERFINNWYEEKSGAFIGKIAKTIKDVLRVVGFALIH